MAPRGQRGGYQRPREPASYSGVGSRSRRTDGQPIRTPNVTEGTDLTIGQRRIIEEGQRVKRLGRTPEPRVSPAGGAAPSVPGGGGPPGGLPDFLFEGTDRPDEPFTEGLPFGPGAGPEVLSPPEPPDEVDEFLQYMVRETGDMAITNMLDEHREFEAYRTQRAEMPTQVAPPGPEVIEPEAEEAGPLEATEMDFGDDFEEEAPEVVGGEVPEEMEMLPEDVGGEAAVAPENPAAPPAPVEAVSE